MNPSHFAGPINPVPIIASLETIPTSSCSEKPLYSSGSIGSTRYLISAVESQIRILVVSGNLTPYSDRHFIGSLTTLDRYSSDLYQVGECRVMAMDSNYTEYKPLCYAPRECFQLP